MTRLRPRLPTRQRRLLPGPARTWAVVVVGLSAAGTTALALLYLHDTAPGHLDEFLSNRLSAQLAGLRAPMLAVAGLGDPWPVVIMTAVVALASLGLQGPRAAALAAAGPLLAGTTGELVLKPLVDRRLGGDLALPSGHATGVAAVAVTVVIIVGFDGRLRARTKAIVIGFAVLPVLAVDASLTALGLHYGTDTIAGALVATGTVCLVALTVDSLAGSSRAE